MIQLIVVFSIVAFGFQLMQDDDMIFEWYRNLLVKLRRRGQLWKKLVKPLGLCITCNSFWIGFIGSLILKRPVVESIIIGCGCVGLATLIKLIHSKILNSME